MRNEGAIEEQWRSNGQMEANEGTRCGGAMEEQPRATEGRSSDGGAIEEQTRRGAVEEQ
jgi:hypothetical protein